MYKRHIVESLLKDYQACGNGYETVVQLAKDWLEMHDKLYEAREAFEYCACIDPGPCGKRASKAMIDIWNNNEKK